MPKYTALSTDTVGVMKKSLETLQKDIAETKKKDKKKAAELEKQYAQKVQVFLKKLNDDIKIAKEGCNAMTLQIEAYLGEAMKSIQTAKKALEDYKKTRQQSDLTTLEHCPAYGKSLGELAAKEMTEYAASWDSYRQFNPGDPKAAAEFNTIRNAIMDYTKNMRVKVNKIESMAQEAAALKTASADASAMTLATNEDKAQEAQELVKRLTEMLKPITGGKETVDAVINNAKNYKTYVVAPINDLKTRIKNLESQYSFTVKSVQSFTSTVSSMQKVLATGKSAIHPMYLKDPDVAAALKQADDLVVHWAGEVKKAQVAMTGMAADLKKAQDRVKAGK